MKQKLMPEIKIVLVERMSLMVSLADFEKGVSEMEDLLIELTNQKL